MYSSERYPKAATLTLSDKFDESAFKTSPKNRHRIQCCRYAIIIIDLILFFFPLESQILPVRKIIRYLNIVFSFNEKE